ncbi:hypothetical protein IU450_33515 [Nocardia abscessus]|nr:hypothetical protein [Nocardia abscessus]MBF6340778.1 hypothetical protein [Nocardia abscessus]
MGSSLLATLRPRHGLVQDTGTVGDGRAGLLMARGDAPVERQSTNR